MSRRFGFLSRRRPAASVLPAMPRDLPRHAGEPHRAAIAAARDLPDGTRCDAVLLAAIAAEIHARRAATATLDGPASPRTTDLHVRRLATPDWWEAGDNLLLCAPDVDAVEIELSLFCPPPHRAIVVIGAGGRPPRLQFTGDDALVAIGDRTIMLASVIAAGETCTVLLGEHCSATWMTHVDVRNGGILLVGDDNMWANGIMLLTDDLHAIREVDTGRRINLRGGRIVIERHVWLGEQSRVMGDCHIGHDAIVGQGSFVRNVRLAPNTTSVGRPVRTIRGGVTWTRDDAE